jgi:adenine phosphoribosyltransferase
MVKLKDYFEDYVKNIPDFPKKGVSFKDISPLLSNHQIFKNCIESMGSLVKKPDNWVGIDARGFLFASALSYEFGGGLVMCRKKGKLPPPVESYSYQLEYGEDTLEIQPGEGTVVIVDDVYATGGTMKAVEKLCEKAGYKVIDKICLIDLLYLHDGIECKSIISYK